MWPTYPIMYSRIASPKLRKNMEKSLIWKKRFPKILVRHLDLAGLGRSCSQTCAEHRRKPLFIGKTYCFLSFVLSKHLGWWLNHPSLKIDVTTVTANVLYMVSWNLFHSTTNKLVMFFSRRKVKPPVVSCKKNTTLTVVIFPINPVKRKREPHLARRWRTPAFPRINRQK